MYCGYVSWWSVVVPPMFLSMKVSRWFFLTALKITLLLCISSFLATISVGGVICSLCFGLQMLMTQGLEIFCCDFIVKILYVFSDSFVSPFVSAGAWLPHSAEVLGSHWCFPRWSLNRAFWQPPSSLHALSHAWSSLLVIFIWIPDYFIFNIAFPLHLSFCWLSYARH